MLAFKEFCMIGSAMLRSLTAGLVVGLAVSAVGCGGDETGTQVAVDKEKSAALLKSMSGYSGYNKKQGKAKAAAPASDAPVPAEEPAKTPAP